VAIAVFFAGMATSFFMFPINLAYAESETTRRLSAEIVVMKADLKRIIYSGLSLQHKKGLKTRIKGGVAILPLLIRKSWNGLLPLPSHRSNQMKKIQSALNSGNYIFVYKELDKLILKYPFNTKGLLPPDNRPLAIQRSKRIHESFCAGCHDEPDTSISRPAWSLFELSKNNSLKEFSARMVIGIRGDSLTGLDNPLRDSEISALIAYYRRSTPKSE
jgi:hypothetical protein